MNKIIVCLAVLLCSGCGQKTEVVSTEISQKKGVVVIRILEKCESDFIGHSIKLSAGDILTATYSIDKE